MWGRRRPHIISPSPSIPSIFFSFYPFKIPIRRFVTFLKKLSIFCLLKTFLSYQQVINNAPFSTQVFENFSADRRFFGTFAQPY